MIVVLVAILVLTGISDRLIARTTVSVVAPAVTALSTLRVAPAAKTESSAWFCAGGRAALGTAR